MNSKITKYLFYLLLVAIYIKVEFFSMVVSISSSVNGASVDLPRPTVRNNAFPALHTLTEMMECSNSTSKIYVLVFYISECNIWFE